MCNGDYSCLYDLDATNDVTIAQKSGAVNEVNVERNAALGAGITFLLLQVTIDDIFNYIQCEIKYQFRRFLLAYGKGKVL